MSKGKTPLYISSVDTINDLLDRIQFDPALPPHRRSINKAGHNVEWLRKSIKRGTVSATGPDFDKLTQLLEVPQDKMRQAEPADPRKLEWLAKQSDRPKHLFRTREEQAKRASQKNREFSFNYGSEGGAPTGREEPTLSSKPGSYGAHRQRATSEGR